MKKKVYESPVTTCRQVLMETNVMVASDTRMKVSAGKSEHEESPFEGGNDSWLTEENSAW